jgi:hypothetical protein
LILAARRSNTGDPHLLPVHRPPGVSRRSDPDPASHLAKLLPHPAARRLDPVAPSEAVPRDDAESTRLPAVHMPHMGRVLAPIVDVDVVDDPGPTPSPPPGGSNTSTCEASPPRITGFPPAQRNPSDPGRGQTERNRDRGTEGNARPVEPYERRGVDGARYTWAGPPVPAAVQSDPAAVVERRPSPGGGIQPGPSPRVDPDPATIAIGSPSRFDDRGAPECPITGPLLPDTIFVEVFRSVDFLTDVTVASRRIDSSGPALVPGVQFVGLYRNQVGATTGGETRERFGTHVETARIGPGNRSPPTNP